MEKSRAMSENKNEGVVVGTEKKEIEKKLSYHSPSVWWNFTILHCARGKGDVYAKYNKKKRMRHVGRANNEITRVLPPRDCERILIIIFGNNTENDD